MRMIRHMQWNIAGALKRTDEELDGIMNWEDGTPLTGAEARKELLEYQAKGWKVFPVGKCPTFDYQTGCPGHPEKEGDHEA